MFEKWEKWTGLVLAAVLSISAPAYAHADALPSATPSPAVAGTDSKIGDTDNPSGSDTAPDIASGPSLGQEGDAGTGSGDTDNPSTETALDGTSTESVSADSSSDTENPGEGGTSLDLSGLDFSSMRLVVGTDDASLVAGDTAVVGSCNKVYLAQYGSEEETENAYKKYYGRADFVEPDTGLGAAGDAKDNTSNTMTEEPMTEDNNPMEELSSVDTPSGKTLDSADAVALIDTGSSSYTSGSVSMLGDDGTDKNGHGTEMAKIIRDEAGNTPILSIKALNDNGDGTVSSVYAAMEYAISRKVKVINLSLSGYAMDDSVAIDQAVRDADSAGILVVGAAGNNGKDVKYFVPGKIGSAVIVGACDKNGNRLETSNYGDTVDYYVTAESTSEAAARFAGLLAKNGFAVDDAAKADGVFTADGESLGATEEKTEENADKNTDKETKLSTAADTITVTLNANGGTFSDGSTTKQVQCTAGWFGCTYNDNKKNFPYPNKSGQAFYGWNTTANATSEMSSYTNLTDGETLYALYTASSGTWGTCPWSFDSTTGVLTIGAGTGVRGGIYHFGGSDYPWNSFTTKITNINLTGTVHLPDDSSSLFSGCTSLTSIVNCANLDTSNVTDMNDMFYNCSKLASLDVTNFNTSKVTDMNYMFYDCSKLTSLDVTNFDTSNVTDMNYMFYDCSKLTSLDVTNFNTSKVTDMGGMFYGCSKLASLDVTNFNTSNVTDMSSMFSGCNKLTSLDVTNFSTSKVTNMGGILGGMFSGCSGLTSLNVSNFDTSNVTNMNYMFYDCNKLTSLDLTKFNTSKVTNMNDMFSSSPFLSSSLAKLSFSTNFVIPASATDVFSSSAKKTYSGKATNNTWGLNSENATTSYSVSDFTALGQTKGKLVGTWYLQAVKQYTLTYNGNGGTPSSTTKTGYEGDQWGILATATRTGYTFQGWYTAASGGTQVTSNTSCTANLTVYAHWKANSYTISFDANGGSGTTASVSATYDGNMPSITNGISRSGYTFTGFYDAKTGGTKYYNADGSSARTWNKAANKTLYAQWTLTPYKFDVNPQSHVTGFRLKKNDADADNGTTIGDYYADAHMEDVFYLYSPTFATGYEFSSFTKQYGPGSQSTSGSTATITMGAGAQAIAINAKPITYTISYNLNGGSVGGNPSSYNIESAAFTLKNPTRPGYTFKGWTGSNGSTPQTSVAVSKGSTGNRSYTANWVANTNTKYTVIHQQEQLDGTYQTVETQNLTGATDTKVTPAVKSYTGFTSPTTQTVNIAGAGNTVVTYKYVRNTYTITRQFRLENADGTFTGYTQIDSNKYKYGASIASWNRPEDTTYKAATIAAYTVTAKNTTLSVNVMRNTSTNNAIQYRLQNADGSYPTTYTSAWSGTLRYGESHTWNYAQTASHQAASKSVSYNGGTVKVDVSRRTGHLVIHANGGTGDRTTTAILYGVSDKISPMPTRTGYTLTGLYTATSGGTKVVNADGTMTNDGIYSKNGAWLLNSDINVYAQWKANTYTISYTMNGGTNSSSNPTSYNVTSAAITLTAPTKSGWTFTGWSGTGLTGSANKTVTIAAGSTGNRTYTAHWSKTITLTQMQGGTAKTTQTYTMTDSETSHTFTLPSTSTQSYSGWTFDGWLNATTPKAHDYTPGASLAISDNKTVYATFKQTQTLTFIDYNGTTKRTQTVTGTAYGNSSAGGVGNQYPKLTAPAEGTYTGWSARGWSASTASNGSVSVASSGSISNAKTGTYYGLYQQGVTLTYAANGGSSTPSTQNGTRYVNSYAITTYTNPTFALASAISRTGYAFTGWSVSAPISGTKAAGSSITPASGTALTATAQWSLTTYTITYNLNGGTNSSSNPSSYNMTSNAITLAAPTRTGYTFTGWTGSNGTTAQKTVTIASGSTGNKSYTANWTANSYTIAFNANGGSGTMTNESMTYDTAETLTANSFTRTGYTFAGWNTKADGSGTSYANGATVKNLAAGGTVTLYAQWKPNTYTDNISHWTWGYKNQEGNNGNKTAFQLGSTDFTGTYGTSYTVGTDRSLTLPNGFTLRNTFSTSAISGSWTAYAMGTSVTQKAETMHYEYDYDPITYTITYAMNGGTNSSANPSTYNVLYGVTFQNPTRTGYTFSGWTIGGKAATGINAGANATFSNPSDLYTKLAARTTGNQTVTANWAANTYTVAFNANGGTGTMPNESMTYDTEKALTTNAYTKKGYTFTGWNTKADGSGTKYTDKASVKNLAESGTVTIYAQWKANSYRVTYNANGGKGTMADSTAIYGQNFVTSKNVFNREGYTFNGWNEKADGSGTPWKLTSAGVYENGNGTRPWKWTYTGNITLYAQWTANTYTVTIPTAITYTNMPTGSVDMTNTYNISVQCKTGSFGDTIEVSSTPSAMLSKSGKGKSLTVTSGSSKTPLSFTADGTKQDKATIKGTTNTADTWTGSIQYTVTEK